MSEFIGCVYGPNGEKSHVNVLRVSAVLEQRCPPQSRYDNGSEWWRVVAKDGTTFTVHETTLEYVNILNRTCDYEPGSRRAVYRWRITFIETSCASDILAHRAHVTSNARVSGSLERALANHNRKRKARGCTCEDPREPCAKCPLR